MTPALFAPSLTLLVCLFADYADTVEALHEDGQHDWRLRVSVAGF